MTVLAKIELSKARGPEMLIRCLRVRQANTTLSFQALFQGHCDQVRRLIIEGEASVLDIDQRGLSLLHVSTVQFRH